MQKITSAKGAVCRGTSPGLLNGSGIPARGSITRKPSKLSRIPGFAVRDRVVTRFLSVQHHNRFPAEAYVLAVNATQASLKASTRCSSIERDLCAQGLKYLTVKTLAPDQRTRQYEATRGLQALRLRAGRNLSGFVSRQSVLADDQGAGKSADCDAPIRFRKDHRSGIYYFASTPCAVFADLCAQ